MRVRPVGLWLFACLISFAGMSQPQRSLEDLSSALLHSITTSADISDTTFITLEEYHRVIDRQPLSRSQQSEFKTEVNEFFPSQKEAYLAELEKLQRIYVNEINTGASIHLDTVLFKEMEGTYNIFEVRIVLTFIYVEDEEKQETQVFLDTMAASTRRRWSFISPVIEAFE